MPVDTKEFQELFKKALGDTGCYDPIGLYQFVTRVNDRAASVHGGEIRSTQVMALAIETWLEIESFRKAATPCP